MNLDDILIFDIEVFPYDSFVVIKDIHKNSKLFHDKNHFAGLYQYIQGKTLVGFNNFNYDDHILDYMLTGKTQKQIKDLNDRIIAGEKQKPKKYLKTLDTYQQIDVSMPSLKKIQGNFGKMILESSIPFDLQRPMTKEEYREAVDYCSYDVDNTIEIFKMRIDSYFAPKQYLVDMVGEKGYKWNTTTLSANVLLGNNKLQKWSEIRLNGEDRDDLSLLELVPEEVREMWLNTDVNANPKGKKKVVIEAFGCEIEFAFGGLHGVHKKIKKVKNLILLDVASMYPNIILILNVLAQFSKIYRELLEKRIAIKHIDQVLSEALKLILNSVYGNLNSEYSTLYNPKALLSVCAYGQIVLYTLCKRLADAGHTIININTDGVGFIPRDGVDYEEIWHEWEKEFKLTLEEDSFDEFIQKNVNVYIGKKGDKLKCKGGDVARYKKDGFFKNNSARIIDIALVDYLLYGKSVIDTLIENLDNPYLYQYIIKAGNTYEGVFDVNGNQYQKVNRVFPSKKGELCLYKKRADGGLVRFPDLPERMFVWNRDCSEIEKFEKIIDLNHYLTIINKKISQWETE